MTDKSFETPAEAKESHLLFPDLCLGLCWCFWTHICHLWVTFAFFRKKQMWLLGASLCVFGLVYHLWMAFAFSRKSKCDSWGPLLVSLDSYIIYEWHLLFPEKANVTTGGALPVFLHIYWHLWVAFAFLEKANVALCLVVWTHICHLRVVYAVSGTPGTWNQPNFWNLGPLVQLEIF